MTSIMHVALLLSCWCAAVLGLETAHFGPLQVPAALSSRLGASGFAMPMPVQRQAMPLIAEGENVVLHSATGSGKTLAFLVPLIASLNAEDGLRTVIAAPSQELAVQIAAEAERLLRPEEEDDDEGDDVASSSRVLLAISSSPDTESRRVTLRHFVPMLLVALVAQITLAIYLLEGAGYFAMPVHAAIERIHRIAQVFGLVVGAVYIALAIAGDALDVAPTSFTWAGVLPMGLGVPRFEELPRGKQRGEEEVLEHFQSRRADGKHDGLELRALVPGACAALLARERAHAREHRCDGQSFARRSAARLEELSV